MDRYDVYTQFADRHLSTDAERCVYLLLVSHQGRVWSVADLAAHAGVEPEDTDQILHRYLAAGIVEDIDTATSTRYRWSSDLAYLPGAQGESVQWRDPVCDMPVTADSQYRVKDRGGRSWRFCSSGCQTVFAATPDLFSTPVSAQP